MVYILIIYLVVLSIWDIQRREFPVGAVLGGLGVSLIYGIVKGKGYSLLLGVIPGILLVLMGFLTREKVGYGDGILVIIIGLILGWPGSFVIYVIAQFGVLFYAVFLLVARHTSGDVKIPFAPFLAMSVVLYQVGGAIL